MKRPRKHRPSNPENAPKDGYLYFILPNCRLTRRWDMDCLPVPSHWTQVSLARYLVFREETRLNYTAKHLRALRKLHGDT